MGNPVRTALEKGRDALRLAWEYGSTTRVSHREAPLFDGVEAFCLFVGYPRSGHSLVGALLDAHPHALVAHEASALQYVHAGFDRDRLFHALLANSARHAADERRAGEYVYAVPGQWQGRYDDLRVIGDKQGEGANLRLRAHPELLDRLRRLARVPVRVIHVVRNPFDNIATMARRAAPDGAAPDLEAAAARYFDLCASAETVRARVDPADWIELRHEDFVARPAAQLGRICARLGLPLDTAHLMACAAIVRDRPNPSRFRVPWSDRLHDEVLARTIRFPSLRRYTFED